MGGKAKILAGTVFGGGAVAEKVGLLDQAQDAVDKVNQAKGLYDSVHDLAASLFGSPTVIAVGIALIVAGVAVWLLAERIKAHRVDDHRTGRNAGPIEG